MAGAPEDCQRFTKPRHVGASPLCSPGIFGEMKIARRALAPMSHQWDRTGERQSRKKGAIYGARFLPFINVLDCQVGDDLFLARHDAGQNDRVALGPCVKAFFSHGFHQIVGHEESGLFVEDVHDEE